MYYRPVSAFPNSNEKSIKGVEKQTGAACISSIECPNAS